MNTDDERQKRRYDVSLQTRALEIELFWKRSIFFLGFVASAFIAYAAFSGEKARDPYLSAIVSLFGFICSFSWILANKVFRFS